MKSILMKEWLIRSWFQTNIAFPIVELEWVSQVTQMIAPEPGNAVQTKVQITQILQYIYQKLMKVRKLMNHQIMSIQGLLITNMAKDLSRPVMNNNSSIKHTVDNMMKINITAINIHNTKVLWLQVFGRRNSLLERGEKASQNQRVLSRANYKVRVRMICCWWILGWTCILRMRKETARNI